jgi:UDP-N-acetylglucosamine diphosphorylase/glucosamine-1-phosphate N-acetyltransferase
MKALIYEDEKWVNLTPLTYLRPVFELKCGTSNLLEKILHKISNLESGLWVRDYLISLTQKKHNQPVNKNDFFIEDLLLINGRWLAKPMDKLNLEKESIFMSEQEIVYAIIKKETINKFWKGDVYSFLEQIKNVLPIISIQAEIIKYPWDLVHKNSEMLKYEFDDKGKKGIEGDFSPHAVVHGPKDRLYISKDAEVHPFVVLDTNSGSIFIDKKVKIFPYARIEGPCYIGQETQIMPGANIREGNSFGPCCRIGGEVEESIIHGYSNKYHDGFIGHAYICKWVNLGGLTTNSDLKNDYSTVSVYVNESLIDTGDLKVGSFIGDHTKTSIGVLLNTGTSAGIMCNITAGGILPKFFPSFTWFINNKYMKGFGLEQMIETARKAMSRRNINLSEEEENIIRHVYKETQLLRNKYIKKTQR